MKRLALSLALLAAGAAHAQTQKVFRCVDARGATYYTEKPAPGCKPTRIESGQSTAPASKVAAPAPKANPQDIGPNVKRSFTPKPTARAHCDGLAEEAARMNAGKTGLASQAAGTRLASIEKELERSCR